MLYWIVIGLGLSVTNALAFAVSDTSITRLKFLDEYVVSFNQDFKSTTIGGLSGIDYDADDDVYYLLSDDRSSINPARFYKAKIKVTDRRIDTIEFLDFSYLSQPDGSQYPDARIMPLQTIDPEGLRYNGKLQQLVWVSEGERGVKKGKFITADPSINVMDRSGKFTMKYPIPSLLAMDSLEKGPRQNGALEGLAFDDTFKTLYIALEEPLYEDGPQAALQKTDSWVRIFSFDTRTKANTRQVAYPLEPIAHPSMPSDAFKMNGVSEIEWVSQHELLVVERSFSMGRLPCTIRVFLADLTSASDVSKVKSLASSSTHKPVAKKLLLNSDDLGFYVDNIEGVTFGPVLPNGNKSLIFVSDNNFNPLEKTQFLLFEVIP